MSRLLVAYNQLQRVKVSPTCLVQWNQKVREEQYFCMAVLHAEGRHDNRQWWYCAGVSIHRTTTVLASLAGKGMW